MAKRYFKLLSGGHADAEGNEYYTPPGGECAVVASEQNLVRAFGREKFEETTDKKDIERAKMAGVEQEVTDEYKKAIQNDLVVMQRGVTYDVETETGQVLLKGVDKKGLAEYLDGLGKPAKKEE